MSILQQLREFPLTAICALIDEKTKSIYMYYSSTNCLNETTRLISSLRKRYHDNKELQRLYDDGGFELFVIKEYKPAPIEQIIRAEFTEIINKYKAAGYKNLRENYSPVHYSLCRRILSDFRGNTRGGSLIYITALSKRSDELLLGCFNNKEEADEWVARTFPGEPEHIVPVFCQNELSREYAIQYGMRIKTQKLRIKKEKRKRSLNRNLSTKPIDTL
jgi:hypothetical protein